MSSTLRGIPAAAGVAIGSGVLYDPQPPFFRQHQIAPEAITEEKERLQQAIKASMQEVSQLRDQVEAKLGKEEAAIFDAHLLILEDEALLEAANQRIEQELMNAERALWEAAEEFAQILAGLSDSYFQARAADIHDIRTRVISHLQGKSNPSLRFLNQPVVVAARDLLPSDTAGLDATYVLGLATEQGGPTSHTAILARQMGIPAVVGVPGLLSALQSHETLPQRVALDGSAGTVEIDPDAATIASYEAALQKHRQQQEQLQSFRLLPAITLDNVMVEIAANIGSPHDAKLAAEAGANGVGLFRTEFLFLDRTTPPDEGEQLAAYSAVLEVFAGKTVIVRTLDIGGDKSIPYLHLAAESNPFLGLRGIRLCLSEEYQYLFRAQLRALLRAAEAPAATLWIMLPMISDIGEIRKTKALIAEIEAELLQEGKLRTPVKQQIRMGIMVETPAAAQLVDVMAKEVDVFRIGAGNLAQYTLASDRMTASLAALHRPFRPAVMRSIAEVVTPSRGDERWVGMCCEMAGRPRATAFLLGLGINELSMESSSLNAVKQVIRNTTTTQAQALVERVLQAESAGAVEELLTR